jgi:hypothetical protein
MRIEIFRYYIKHVPTDTIVAGFNDSKRVVCFLNNMGIGKVDYYVIDQDLTGATLELTARTFIERHDAE